MLIEELDEVGGVSVIFSLHRLQLANNLLVCLFEDIHFVLNFISGFFFFLELISKGRNLSL